MRVLCLVTHSSDCDKFWHSLTCLGHECRVQRYDDRPHHRHGELVDIAKRIEPELILYIGAIEVPGISRPVPSTEVLRSLKSLAPTVHLCSDASDPDWWPWLENYHREACFSVQVSIDGNPDTPLSQHDNGLVLLTPLDPMPFVTQSKPWAERTVKASQVGGIGHKRRQQVINHLQSNGLLEHHYAAPNANRAYSEMAAIMGNSKFTVNVSENGSGRGVHVKGRVIEAAFAGCCLLEDMASPLRLWMIPGVEYLAYSNPEHAAHIIRTMSDEDAKNMATCLQARVFSEHHPKRFWDKVLAKVQA